MLSNDTRTKLRHSIGWLVAQCPCTHMFHLQGDSIICGPAELLVSDQGFCLSRCIGYSTLKRICLYLWNGICWIKGSQMIFDLTLETKSPALTWLCHDWDMTVQRTYCVEGAFTWRWPRCEWGRCAPWRLGRSMAMAPPATFHFQAFLQTLRYATRSSSLLSAPQPRRSWTKCSTKSASRRHFAVGRRCALLCFRNSRYIG